MAGNYLESDLEKGELLPLMEAFYTLQGEGFHTGKAAFFIRIGGCDVGCRWCDVKESWDPLVFPPVDVATIVNQAVLTPAKTLVVTGGEPLMYNLDKLCDELIRHNFECHLETSGAYSLSGRWHWICLSPKPTSPPLPEMYRMANELKVVIETADDFVWAEENAAKVSSSCHLYLQPEWKRSAQIIPEITEYIMKNPVWSISLQSHKYMNIP